MLSEQTICKIAGAVKKDVIKHIYSNPKFSEAIQELVTEALDATMGEMDEDLYFELAMILFDNIELK